MKVPRAIQTPQFRNAPQVILGLSFFRGTGVSEYVSVMKRPLA